MQAVRAWVNSSVHNTGYAQYFPKLRSDVSANQSRDVRLAKCYTTNGGLLDITLSFFYTWMISTDVSNTTVRMIAV